MQKLLFFCDKFVGWVQYFTDPFTRIAFDAEKYVGTGMLPEHEFSFFAVNYENISAG